MLYPSVAAAVLDVTPRDGKHMGSTDVESPAAMLSRQACENVTGGVADTASCYPDVVFDEMTHAVVNALNTIAAASELTALLIARAEPAEAAEPLSRIESECMRAARLLRDGRGLMTLSIGAAKDEVDISALLNACADSFAERVQIDIDGTLPAPRGDADALRRACMEILNNAFQFGASRVRVAVKHAVADQAIHIEFQDDGPGFTAPAARLFDPFFSTCPAEHSGLGLALAARIATAHAGSIGVDNSAQGATFWIKLPVRND